MRAKGVRLDYPPQGKQGDRHRLNRRHRPRRAGPVGTSLTVNARASVRLVSRPADLATREDLLGQVLNPRPAEQPVMSQTACFSIVPSIQESSLQFEDRSSDKLETLFSMIPDPMKEASRTNIGGYSCNKDATL